MSNVLPMETRVRVVAALLEGNGVRASARIVGVDKDAVTRLGALVGAGCARIHDRRVRGLPAATLELDGIGPRRGEAGEAYSFLGIDRRSRLVVAHATARRTVEDAMAFLCDLRARVEGRPRIEAGTWPHYPDAVAGAFGLDGAELRVGIALREEERSSGALRASTRRLLRAAHGACRRVESLRAVMALQVAHHNLCRGHEQRQVTPAVLAGLADHAWSVRELVEASLAEAGG